MHHPVGKIDLVKKICCFMNSIGSHFIYFLQRIHDVDDDSFISVECKCPLEHYGDPSCYVPSQRVVKRQCYKINIEFRKCSLASGACSSYFAWFLDKSTLTALGKMIYNIAEDIIEFFHTSQDMQKNGFTCTAFSKDAKDLSFFNLKVYIFKNIDSIKANTKIFDFNK